MRSWCFCSRKISRRTDDFHHYQSLAEGKLFANSLVSSQAEQGDKSPLIAYRCPSMSNGSQGTAPRRGLAMTLIVFPFGAYYVHLCRSSKHPHHIYSVLVRLSALPILTDRMRGHYCEITRSSNCLHPAFSNERANDGCR